ncbi:MAG: glycosyltransferase family 39 protein [Selenomonadaceae bacterium]|nr:glycosyltransferase family 39 protein [Selenomonadaceae bacterium]
MENKTLIFLCLVLFFFCNWLIPVTDPTENCYALTAKEMLQAGDYFSPRIYGNFWYDKPIFFYWEILLAYKIFGVNEFALRFFPAVFATAGVFLTYFFTTKIFNKQVGFTAAVILATSPEYWYIAHAIITDMTLFCAISTTLMTFFLSYTEKNPKYLYVAFAAAGVAVLTKGPIGFLLPGLIIFLFLISQRDLKYLLRLEILKGAAIMLAIISTWYLPMYLIHGQQFLTDFIGVHNFLRATVSEHPQYDVWYYYAVVFLIGFFPWLLALIRIKKLPPLDSRRRFLIIWAATVFVVFQSFATKYPTYTLPYMMPIAILFGEYFSERQKIFQRIAAAMVVFFTAGIFVALPICETNSHKETAKIILPLADEKTCVVSYGQAYAGSLVFYSGLTVYRLEETEKIAKLKPAEMKWTTTNVMPFLDFKDLPAEKVIAVVEKNFELKFLELAKGNWQLVAELPEYKIFIKN